ncbi:MAG: PEP-CTERM/exosortase system-associated acyltransferase [Burkholderiales bacterium]|nr:PEP-CTERM/exosortase system-associated acyltransferase [Burkholderiales bacterium]
MAVREAARSTGIVRFMNNLALTRSAYRAFAGYMFHRYFNAVAAGSEELRNEVFRIRYDVYCDELRFEDPARFPDKREVDPYDQFSLHCLLLHKASDAFAGCVRLVQVNPQAPAEPLPFERLCHDRMYADLLRELVPDRLKVAEISRLAVRSSFRRRKGESGVPGGIVEERKSGFGNMRTPWIALGLYLSAAAIGLIRGLNGVFALMEPRLARRLGTYGIKFIQVGDPVEHRGERAPFFISREGLYAGVPPPVRGLLEVIEDDLRKTGAAEMVAAPVTRG